MGKTTLGLDLEVAAALPGHPVAWFSPTYKMLADVWRTFMDVLTPITVQRSVQEHRLELLGGGVVEMWSLDDPDPARGRKYRRVVIDEAAMVRNLADAWQMAIRPTLTDYVGDAWFLSTPRGLNYFHTLFQLGQDVEQSGWRSWQFPTSANPYIRPDEIEAAREQLPERAFAQEFLAQFLADGAGVFRRVQEATTRRPTPAVDGHTYVLGVDWGKLHDFTVLCVVDETTREQVWIDRFNRIDYAFQVERLAGVVERYRPRVIVAESNSMGTPLVETLQRRKWPVWPWTATNASKAAAIEGLSLALERGRLSLLDDPVQTAELLAYDAERLPSGMLRYGAPDGMHDDTVMALALAWLAADQPPAKPVSVHFGERSGRRRHPQVA